MLNNKFIYQSENELQTTDNQCELCLYYNNGKRNNICPKEILTDIEEGNLFCPNLLKKSIIESPFFTKEDAIKLYFDRFGTYPSSEILNFSDEIVIDKIIEILKEEQSNI